MWKRIAAVLSTATMVAVLTVAAAGAHGSVTRNGRTPVPYEPVLDPANFVSVIDNPYFPLPVGRVLVFKGHDNGESIVDTVTVTSDTRVIEGITATAIADVIKHKGSLREKTTDWYAQDKDGNVWYLGEDTKAYLPNGTVDTSGTWLANVNDGEPGIIMMAHPQILDSYRQELAVGANDTAWTVDLGTSLTVPYGTVHNVLTSLEAAQVEPGVYDQKFYAPGVGSVFETNLSAPETIRLVSVTG